MTRKIFLPLFVLLFSENAQAIVNLDALHFESNKLGMSSGFSLGISGSSGNTEKSQINVDGHVKWHFTDHSNFVLANYQYGEAKKTRDTNKAFVHVRHIHRIRNYASDWEVYGQLQSDEFTRLSLRALVGGGIRMPLHENEESVLKNYLGVGVFYSRERYDPLAGQLEEETQNIVRGNFYLLTRYKFTETAKFFNTFYYQPDVAEFGDYRILEVATLKVAIDKSLDLKFSVQISHDSKPPATVEQTDINYLTALEYAFD